MKKIITIVLLLGFILAIRAQQVYSLQDCRDLALQQNKQLSIAKLQVDVAKDLHNSAKTKYLPRVDAIAGYTHFSREISILNHEQKNGLSNLGSNLTNKVGTELNSQVSDLVEQGLLPQDAAQQLSNLFNSSSSSLTQAGNNIGQSIRDAFRTNTRNIWVGSVMVTQPIYMGGAIKATNEMARIGENLAQNTVESRQQDVLFSVDNAYWLAVSLKNKQRLAKDYLQLVKKLNDDVHKMIAEGVATRSDGLKVDVGVNTAEVTLTQVENGVSITKMALCELCGLPLNKDIMLKDEDSETLPTYYNAPQNLTDTAYYARPELKKLQNMIEMGRQSTRLVRSLYLPHIALTGGIMVSNPNPFNGCEQKFGGAWNIGVLLQVPILNWGESKYRLRSTRTMTSIAQLQLDDAKNMIALQVEQSRFKLVEAEKRLLMAQKNMTAAEENLRCANVGFKEGVMTVTDVMTAQTAWKTAQSQKIDAEIEVKVSQIALQKALGVL